jgi:hypothetical protein
MWWRGLPPQRPQRAPPHQFHLLIPSLLLEIALRTDQRLILLHAIVISLDARHQAGQIREQCSDIAQQGFGIGWSERLHPSYRTLHALICSHELLM